MPGEIYNIVQAEKGCSRIVIDGKTCGNPTDTQTLMGDWIFNQCAEHPWKDAGAWRDTREVPFPACRWCNSDACSGPHHCQASQRTDDPA